MARALRLEVAPFGASVAKVRQRRIRKPRHISKGSSKRGRFPNQSSCENCRRLAAFGVVLLQLCSQCAKPVGCSRRPHLRPKGQALLNSCHRPHLTHAIVKSCRCIAASRMEPHAPAWLGANTWSPFAATFANLELAIVSKTAGVRCLLPFPPPPPPTKHPSKNKSGPGRHVSSLATSAWCRHVGGADCRPIPICVLGFEGDQHHV